MASLLLFVLFCFFCGYTSDHSWWCQNRFSLAPKKVKTPAVTLLIWMSIKKGKQVVQLQLSALKFDDRQPFWCSRLKQTTKTICMFFWSRFFTVTVLYQHCFSSSSIASMLRVQKESMTFSKAFQFDILNIPLSVQVSCDWLCHLKKRYGKNSGLFSSDR